MKIIFAVEIFSTEKIQRLPKIYYCSVQNLIFTNNKSENFVFDLHSSMYWTFSCIIVSESFQHELCCVTLSNTKPVPATNDYDIQNKRIIHNRMFGIHSNSDVAALSTPVMIILLSNK